MHGIRPYPVHSGRVIPLWLQVAASKRSLSTPSYISPRSLQARAMPSSSTCGVTWLAAAFTSSDALPMATLVPTHRNIEISLPPSPNATHSSGSMPRCESPNVPAPDSAVARRL